ncbi:MAG: amino acid ABC transporter substrate-binding protein [Deltaproteobacteria bacterium]|nr:amino acid ABC transporter substrate-binding protein [Deltaproteobacteria bacterium]
MPTLRSPREITVGVSVSLSGKFRFQAEQALRGIKLWTKVVNQQGGIYLEDRAQSLPVQLIVYDDRSKTEPAKNNVVRLLKEDRVDLLFGTYSTVLTLAVAPIAEGYKKILWNHGGASDAICQQGWHYLVCVLSPASSYLRSLPYYLVKSDPQSYRITCLRASSGTFAAHVADGLTEAAKFYGLSVRQVPFTSPIKDAREIVKTLTDHPDLLVAIGSFQDDVKIVRHCSAIKTIVTVAAGVAAFGQDLGPRAEGIIGPSQWEPGVHYSALRGPNSEWFSSYFKKSFGVPPDYTAAQGFATGVVIQEAIQRAGGLKDERLRRAVADLDIHTFYGSFRIDPKSGLQVSHEILLVQWHKGEKVVVWPPEATG